MKPAKLIGLEPLPEETIRSAAVTSFLISLYYAGQGISGIFNQNHLKIKEKYSSKSCDSLLGVTPIPCGTKARPAPEAHENKAFDTVTSIGVDSQRTNCRRGLGFAEQRNWCAVKDGLFWYSSDRIDGGILRPLED